MWGDEGGRLDALSTSPLIGGRGSRGGLHPPHFHQASGGAPITLSLPSRARVSSLEGSLASRLAASEGTSALCSSPWSLLRPYARWWAQ
jgi:hypothetical protein